MMDEFEELGKLREALRWCRERGADLFFRTAADGQRWVTVRVPGVNYGRGHSFVEVVDDVRRRYENKLARLLREDSRSA